MLLNLKLKMQNTKLFTFKKNFVFVRNCSKQILNKLLEMEQNPKVTARKKASHLYKLNAFFNSEPHLRKILPLIPAKYLFLKRTSTIESLYLIDSKWATKVTEAIWPYLKIQTMLICETLPGFGLITDRILNKNIKTMRLYEPCTEFRKYLKEHHKERPNRIQLYMKDIFQLPRYAKMDKIDSYKRVDQLLDGVYMKLWKDKPSMTIIGPTMKCYFISFLLKELCLQSKIFDNGRIQFFMMMRPSDHLKITSKPENGNVLYGSVSILFSTLFEQKLLLKIPRKSFLPWEMEDQKRYSRFNRHIDRENIYLVRIIPKREFPLKKKDMPAFFYFMKQFYTRRTNKIIPSLEKWVPGCGFNLILPKLNHSNYFKDINIYTSFGEMDPGQALSIFKEMINHPDYERSAFAAMVESQLMKSETIENTDFIDDINKDILDEFMEKKDF